MFYTLANQGSDERSEAGSYTSLAKMAVESYVKEKKIINTPKESLNRKSGVFITIKKDGQLRGCIGTYLPTKENIAEEIISNAIAAATEDYRFGPIQKEELPFLSYTVYFLSKPELVGKGTEFLSEGTQKELGSFLGSFKDIKKLNPKKYGIIVKTESKSGLLLPDLEGVDTVEQQISIACQKGEINPEIENIIIYKFTVEKYE